MKLQRPNVELAQRLDQQLTNQNFASALNPGVTGWITQAIQALGASQVALADVLDISYQAIQKLESHERSRNVTLLRMQNVAEALDCDFVYGFVPRGSFSERAIELEEKQNRATTNHQALPMWCPFTFDDLDQRELRDSREVRSQNRKDQRYERDIQRRKALLREARSQSKHKALAKRLSPRTHRVSGSNEN